MDGIPPVRRTPSLVAQLVTARSRRDPSRDPADLAPTPDPDQLFRWIREMPYRRPADNRPETVIREWRATCSGKHRLLAAVFQELGIPARLMIATYHDTGPPASSDPPEALGRLLTAGPIPDVHNFVEVRVGDRWFPVDATWPLAAQAIGFPVNATWVPGQAHRVAVTPPYQAWPVPAGEDPEHYKRAVIRRFVGPDAVRRERLIALLSVWLDPLAQEPEPT